MIYLVYFLEWVNQLYSILKLSWISETGLATNVLNPKDPFWICLTLSEFRFNKGPLFDRIEKVRVEVYFLFNNGPLFARIEKESWSLFPLQWRAFIKREILPYHVLICIVDSLVLGGARRRTVAHGKKTCDSITCFWRVDFSLPSVKGISLNLSVLCIVFTLVYHSESLSAVPQAQDGRQKFDASEKGL